MWKHVWHDMTWHIFCWMKCCEWISHWVISQKGGLMLGHPNLLISKIISHSPTSRGTHSELRSLRSLVANGFVWMVHRDLNHHKPWIGCQCGCGFWRGSVVQKPSALSPTQNSPLHYLSMSLPSSSWYQHSGSNHHPFTVASHFCTTSFYMHWSHLVSMPLQLR